MNRLEGMNENSSFLYWQSKFFCLYSNFSVVCIVTVFNSSEANGHFSNILNSKHSFIMKVEMCSNIKGVMLLG